MRVLFPAPFGPTRPNTAPSGTPRSTPPSALCWPYHLVSRLTSMASTYGLLTPPEPSQKYPGCVLYVLFVGQPILSDSRKEQLASGLGEEHPYKGAGAGPHVVRTEPAELDLALHVTLQKPQHPLYYRFAEYLRDLGPPHGLPYHQPHHPLGGRIVEGREVPPGYGDRKSTRLNSSHANISYAV